MNHLNKFPEAEMQDLARDAMRLVCTHNVMRERIGDTKHAWECAHCGYVYGQSSEEAEKQTELKEMALAAKLENEACAALGVF